MKTATKFVTLLIIVFILNLIWEYSHASLYISDMLLKNYNYTLIRASVADTLFIGFIFLIISLKNKGIKWISSQKKDDYTLIIIFGIIIAIIIELNALMKGKWVYKEVMPTIFGIGISPLVQLFTTAILGLFLLNRISSAL